MTVFDETITLNSIGIGADAPRTAVGAPPPERPLRPPPPPTEPPRAPPPSPPPLRGERLLPRSPNSPISYEIASLTVIDLFLVSILLMSPSVRCLNSARTKPEVHNMMRAARLRYFIGIFYSMKQPRRKARHYSLQSVG